MTNPLAETMTLPRANYMALVTSYCRTMQDRSDTEAPRAVDLRVEIEALVEQAKQADVMLDDESIKTSSKAQEIRLALDKILPEFQGLALAAQKRVVMIKHLRERVTTLVGGSGDVKLSTGEAMVLLNLAEPSFEQVPA